MDEETVKQYEWLRILFRTLKQFFGGIRGLFSGIRDPRDPNRITYSLSCLLFTGLLVFLYRLGARREVHHQLRGNSRSRAKFLGLFGVKDAPHGDTLNYCFKRLNVEEVQRAVCEMIRVLIRRKVLYPFRLLGRYYVIAIDGTGVLTFKYRHCPHCLMRTLNNGEKLYYHPVLEAKLVAPNGFCFSMLTEFIENADIEEDKQDCELKAFYRLAERLKQAFKKLPLCLVLDSLYACGPVFEICGENGWEFIITLKEKALPSVNEEFEALCRLAPENRLEVTRREKNHRIRQTYRFANDIDYRDNRGKLHRLNVLECQESIEPVVTGEGNTSTQTTRTRFRWVSSLRMDEHRIVPIAENGGRIRWKIENEGFNTQKNGGFELEHPYSEHPVARKVFYLLLQMAHTIFQLVEKGSLLKKAFPQGVGSLKNIAKRLLEAWRNLCLKPEAMQSLDAGKFQIRFDTS